MGDSAKNRNQAPNFFYAPLGETRGNPLDSDNLNNNVSKLHSVQRLKEKSENKNQDFWNCLEDAGYEKVTLWGMNKIATNKRAYNDMKENDIVFFGYKNCVVFIGEVYGKIVDEQLTNYLWNQRNGWEYKIILKSLAKVFIPGDRTTYSKEIFYISSEKIKELQNNFKYDRDSFRWILGIPEEKKHFLQGINYMRFISNEEMQNRLSSYFLTSNFESIIKVITKDGI